MSARNPPSEGDLTKDPDHARLEDIYRRGEAIEPPEFLDRTIKQQARASKSKTPIARRWVAGLASAAVIVLSVGVYRNLEFAQIDTPQSIPAEFLPRVETPQSEAAPAAKPGVETIEVSADVQMGEASAKAFRNQTGGSPTKAQNTATQSAPASGLAPNQAPQRAKRAPKPAMRQVYSSTEDAVDAELADDGSFGVLAGACAEPPSDLSPVDATTSDATVSQRPAERDRKECPPNPQNDTVQDELAEEIEQEIAPSTE